MARRRRKSRATSPITNRSKDWLKPGDRPLAFQSRTDTGCPYDCGLCPDHEQHSCLALIEINDECNLTCPVCFADSSPQKTRHRTLAEIDGMLETLVESEREPDLVQISGGEPTIHPQILDILKLAKSKPIRHIMLNTNGIRIARDKAFVAELAELKPGFEVYLQFDSLRKSALENLRGADLRRIRETALANLEEAGISTTLVCVVKRGQNDDEIGAIVRHALTYACVRGVTFQPVQDAGRNQAFDKNRDRIPADRHPPRGRAAFRRVRHGRRHPAAVQSRRDRHRLRLARRYPHHADHQADPQGAAAGRGTEHDLVREISRAAEAHLRSDVAVGNRRGDEDGARRSPLLPAAKSRCRPISATTRCFAW